MIPQSITQRPRFDHCSPIMDLVVDKLTDGKCISLYGMPGYDAHVTAQQIKSFLSHKFPEIKQINLNFDFEENTIEVFNAKLKKVIGNSAIAEFLKEQKIIVTLENVSSLDSHRLFQTLNAIYSQQQDSFTVLSIVNHTLLSKREDYLRSARAIFSNAYGIPLQDLEGVKRIIEAGNSQENWTISLGIAKQIFFLSGGNPALTTATCRELSLRGKKLIDFPDRLAQSEPINSLLCEIANVIPTLSIEDLIRLRIINSNGTLFSRLLTQFLSSQQDVTLKELFPKLTTLDRKIFLFFLHHPGIIINKEQFGVLLEQTAESGSGWAIYKAVERLKHKISPNYRIDTVKGKGWVLKGR